MFATGTLQKWIETESPRELALDGLILHALAVLAIPYADPQHHAYPIDRAHIHPAITYFGKNAHRYPPKLRRQIARRILRAALRYGVEVGKDSVVRQIAEGKDKLPAGKHEPGTSRVYREEHKAEAPSLGSVGPSGPHPFPPLAVEEDARRKNWGDQELFDDIEKLRKWTDTADKEFNLLWDFLSALSDPPPAQNPRG